MARLQPILAIEKLDGLAYAGGIRWDFDLVVERKVVSIIQHLVILGLAASLSAPSHQRQVDLKPDSAAIQRINQLWLVTFIDKAGQEIVAQARTTTGEYMPLIAADAARLETILEAAHGLATANNMTMRLVKFSNRL